MVKKITKKPEVDTTNFSQILADTIRRINANLPKTSRIYSGDQAPIIERIPTPNLQFNKITGGGLPRRRFTQIKGAESSGKTTHLMLTAAQVQRSGGIVVWVAGEEFDKKWAERLGLDTSKLYLIPPHESGERALQSLIDLLSTNVIDLAIIDSFQTIKSSATTDEKIGEAAYGGGISRIWSDFFAKVRYTWQQGSNAAVVWTSQMRALIGNKYQTEDGSQLWAAKHDKSVDVLFRRGSAQMDKPGSYVYARMFYIRCDKNKTADTTNQSAEYTFYFENRAPFTFGLDRITMAIQLGVEYGIITLRGSWYEWGKFRAQGSHDFAMKLSAEPSVLTQLELAVTEVMNHDVV